MKTITRHAVTTVLAVAGFVGMMNVMIYIFPRSSEMLESCGVGKTLFYFRDFSQFVTVMKCLWFLDANVRVRLACLTAMSVIGSYMMAFNPAAENLKLKAAAFVDGMLNKAAKTVEKKTQ